MTGSAPPPPPSPPPAPPPAPPPPPPSAPASPSASWQPPGEPAPASKPRKRWIAVLVGMLALIAAVAIAGTVLFGTRTWPPLHATYQFTDDLQSGNTNAAFSQVCDRLRTSGARRDFNDFARNIEAADSVDVNVLGVDRDGNTATVEFTAHYDDDKSRTTKLKLLHEDGDWRPCGTK